MLRDGAEQDDERGRARDQPGRRAERDQAAAVMVVMVVVAVVVVIVVAARAAAQDRDPDADDHQPGRERQPRVELLRQDPRGEPQRDGAERDDAGRVRDGDGRAEHERVARAAARADEVGGDHRLAVAGRERVQRAPAERGEQQQDEQAVALEQRGEAVAALSPPVAAGASPASTLPRPGRTSNAARVTSLGLASRSSG